MPGDPWPVSAALEIVDESGFQQVTVRAVAARAGYTPMAVYRHVEDLDELLRRVVRHVFEDWESRVYSLLDEDDHVKRLWRYGGVYREYALRPRTGTSRTAASGGSIRTAPGFPVLRSASPSSSAGAPGATTWW